MWTKLFALIEAVKILRDLWDTAQYEWVQYQIRTHGATLDRTQAERNAYLDAIAKAQEDKDEEKIMVYSRLLAINRMSEY